MKYFQNCRTRQEIITRYRELCKMHHPDLGGDVEIMKEINVEYERACKYAGRWSTEDTTQNAGHTGKQTAEQQAAQTADEMRMSEEYRRIIEAIAGLPGIVIEIMGNWIWVTGNTYPVRKQLREAGLWFASQKKAWYYRDEQFASSGGKASLEEIRSKYGSATIHTGDYKKFIHT
jgi:hypothetical protein